MCGYAGYALQAQHPDMIDRATLCAMGEAIRLRGPDDQGVWIEREQKLGLVHQRLAIQDLSPLGAQPMSSPSGRYTLAFNGEVYNFKSLRRELQQQGFIFRGGSDTEVILAAFEAWSVESALTRFTGMFSMALVDNQRQELWLIRDRLGEKPLYYYQGHGCLIFGSELKALMACPLFPKKVSTDALGLLLKHNFIPAPWSIFQNTYKLEPAHLLRFDLRDIDQPAVKKCYWSPSLEWDNSLTEDSLNEQLESLLEEVIADQMISDAPLGAFLSGGVDSSTIVALMQRAATQPVKTFSVGFNVPGYNEAEHARAVAEHLGTDHTEYYVEPGDALKVIPQLASIYCEPFADSSQIPTYIVSQLTRQKVTVALSGDGGDELFAGYSRYMNYARGYRQRRAGIGNQLLGNLPVSASALLTRMLKSNQRVLSKELLREKVARYRRAYASDNPRDYYREQIAYWQDPDLAVSGATMLPCSMNSTAVRADEIATFQWCDLNGYLPDDILVKVDRAAMANSLETRVPLLDHRLVELSLRVPSRLNIGHGGAKQPLRRILYQHVPQELIDRPKQGFALPKGDWLRNELRDWAEDLLSESALKETGYFDADLIRQKWQAHLTTEHDYSFHLWSILMFQCWYNEYMR